MLSWMVFFGKLKDWQESYLPTVDHCPVEKRETLLPVNSINRIFFGLYVGSQGSCTLTRVYRRNVSRSFESTSSEDYLLLCGSQEEQFVLEMKTTTHEMYETY
jgi:hypothetical protein